MPLYLVQAMIASISLTVMLGGLFAVLVWYVDAVDRPGFRRYATKFFVGTAHFLAHLTAMFTLSLLVVSWNNQMAPPILERQLEALYSSSAQPADRPSHPGIAGTAASARTRRSAPSRPQGQPTPIRQLVGFTSYPMLMIALGALVGGSLWGFYWVLTGVVGRMHAEDAFAALRIKNYKNFLRSQVRARQAHHLSARRRQGAGPRPLAQCAERQGQPAAAQPQADRGRSRSTCA